MAIQIEEVKSGSGTTGLLLKVVGIAIIGFALWYAYRAMRDSETVESPGTTSSSIPAPSIPDDAYTDAQNSPWAPGDYSFEPDNNSEIEVPTLPQVEFHGVDIYSHPEASYKSDKRRAGSILGPAPPETVSTTVSTVTSAISGSVARK